MASRILKQRVPVPVRAARVLLALTALSHLVVPVLLWTGRDAVRKQIALQHPDFGAAEVARSADIAVTAGAAFHGVLLILCALLIGKLPTGLPWTRRLTTVSQRLSVVLVVVSWSSSPMFQAVSPIVSAAQILTVVLLWAPRPVRAFFAASRSGAPRKA